MKALYFTYDGVLEPLGRSQVIAYIKGLSRHGIHFVLISYEKKGLLEDRAGIANTRKDLEDNGIKWIPLRYHKRPTVPATLYDILLGIVVGGYVILRNKTKIVHARSYVSALMALVLKVIFGVKFIFDMRGFWVDERIDMNFWPQGGTLYRTAKFFEQLYLSHADRIVVLARAAKEEIMTYEYMKNRNTPIEVIPTCVDLEKFRCIQEQGMKNELGLDGKFVFVYSGVITWLKLKEMMDFYQTAINHLPSLYFLFLVTHGDDALKRELTRRRIEHSQYGIYQIPHDEMAQWLSLGSVGVTFIDRPLSRKGTCPTKFGEFLACGLPVLTNSGIGDTDEIILKEDVGVVVNDFNEREYLRALKDMNRLLQDRGLKERARRVAQKYFSLEEGVERYYSRVYKGLLPQS